jgi:hypothetical protein
MNLQATNKVFTKINKTMSSIPSIAPHVSAIEHGLTIFVVLNQSVRDTVLHGFPVHHESESLFRFRGWTGTGF